MKGLSGSQTLIRGLDVLEAVAGGATNLAALAEALDLNRSTTHRLAATLVGRRYLSFTPRVGYALGPKLLELGFKARAQMSLPRVSREHMETLAAGTGDTVHLGILDGSRALYLDKIPGSRRVEISSRIGERQPLRSTGLGKALILDESEARWRELYEYEDREGKRYDVSLGDWLDRMRDYARPAMRWTLKRMKTASDVLQLRSAMPPTKSSAPSAFRAPRNIWTTNGCRHWPKKSATFPT